MAKIIEGNFNRDDRSFDEILEWIKQNYSGKKKVLWTINEKRKSEFVTALHDLTQVLELFDEEAQISVGINKLCPTCGVLEATAITFSIDDDELKEKVLELIRLADNFEVLPLDRHKIQMNFLFYDLVQMHEI